MSRSGHSTAAIVIPGEAAPRISQLKRQVLFFERVLIPAPDDTAVVSNFEVERKFPGGISVRVGATGVFPRAPEYSSGMQRILQDANPLVRDGLIGLLQAKHPTNVDPEATLRAYDEAISIERVLRAAITDFVPGALPPAMNSGIISGLQIIPPGVHPDSMPKPPQPASLHDVDPAWQAVACGRVGRTIKYLRIGSALGAHPVALDGPMSLCLPSIVNALLPGEVRSADLDAAITSVIIDSSLDDALHALPWKEVRQLRALTLPPMSALHASIAKQMILSETGNSTGAERALRRLLADFRDQQDALSEALHKVYVRVGIVSLGSAATAAGGMQLVQYTLPTSASQWLLLGLSGVGALLATQQDAIGDYFARKRAVSAHPLSFTVELLRRVRSHGN